MKQRLAISSCKHLDSMNSKSIKQFATTLKNTQQMFATLKNDVEDAQYVIETLRNRSHSLTDKNKKEFKAISGDSTLIPFYSSVKK